MAMTSVSSTWAVLRMLFRDDHGALGLHARRRLSRLALTILFREQGSPCGAAILDSLAARTQADPVSERHFFDFPVLAFWQVVRRDYNLLAR